MKGKLFLIIGAALAITALAEVKAALPNHDVVVVVDEAPAFEHTFTIEALPVLYMPECVKVADKAPVAFPEPVAVKPSGSLAFTPVAYGLRSRCRSNLSGNDDYNSPLQALARFRPPLRC